MINISSVVNNIYTLGINGGVRPGYQDVSTVLLKNDEIVAAVEEERLSRIKFSAGQLPIKSVHEVLKIADISINEVQAVGFHGSTWQPEIEGVISSHFENNFGHCPTIHRFHHHDCHAASSYYSSGFSEALIITVDGSGDGVSTRISVGSDDRIKTLKDFHRPQSLGIFYSLMTQICGFTRDSDEYKLMGLAAYGDSLKYDLDWLIDLTDQGYLLNTDYMVEVKQGQPSPSRHEMLFNQKLLNKLNLSRRTSKSIPQQYKDLAASAQFQLEKIIVSLVKKYTRETRLKKVCLAGGVALNCLANKKIEELNEVDELFIQPASSDAGISLGAAYLAAIKQGVPITPKLQNDTFFGRSYTDEEIEMTIKNCSLTYEKIKSVSEVAASSLAAGKVIGWFQGKMEFGPRALGSRSILAHPSVPEIKNLINMKVKFREGYRPFGASVLEEDFATHFNAKCKQAPFMTKVFDVKPEWTEKLSGITHADKTSRVQTVNKNQHPLFYQLLKDVREKTGTGVLLNTSFNLSHEPIVCSPRDAIASFFASGLDELYLGSFRIIK